MTTQLCALTLPVFHVEQSMTTDYFIMQYSDLYQGSHITLLQLNYSEDFP